MVTIKISKDFTPFPAGRYTTDGNYSAERFRNDLLIPAIETHDQVCVDLDGGIGYGSNFLDEAFGGLLRLGYNSTMLLNKLKFTSTDDPYLIDEILSYIDKDSV